MVYDLNKHHGKLVIRLKYLESGSDKIAKKEPNIYSLDCKKVFNYQQNGMTIPRKERNCFGWYRRLN